MKHFFSFIFVLIFSSATLAGDCREEYLFTVDKTQGQRSWTSTLYISKEGIEMTFNDGKNEPETVSMDPKAQMIKSNSEKRGIACAAGTSDDCTGQVKVFKQRFDEILKGIDNPKEKKCAQELYEQKLKTYLGKNKKAKE